MSPEELEPRLFTVDTVGEPGSRTFFLRIEGGFDAVTLVVEKQQVEALADRLRDVLMTIDPEDAIVSALAERDPALTVEEQEADGPRIGQMGLAYDDALDRVILLLQPGEPVAEGAEPPTEEALERDGIRVALRRDQVRAFVLHALAVLEEGRPLCQLCGLPMDPAGHRCPASNGHHLGS